MDLVHLTSEEQFSELARHAFNANFIADLQGFSSLRAHYLDEGVSSSRHVFLCLHGEPTWAYIYRHMIPEFVAVVGRVVAPDLFGFGRSDKPANELSYTSNFHRGFFYKSIEKLDLRNITLVCPDWEGILGLTLPVDISDRFTRLIVMNTMLATADTALSKGFLYWWQWVRDSLNMVVNRLMKRACPHLSNEEAAAYDAPIPDTRFLAGVRRFPKLVTEKPTADGAVMSLSARKW